MNHTDVLKRSWQILWSYRILWIFGFAIALTTCTWQGTFNLGERYDSGQRITVHLEKGTLFIPGFKADIDLTRADGFQVLIPYEEGQPIVINGGETWSVDLPWRMERDLEELADWLSGDIPPDVSEIITGAIVIIVIAIGAIFLLATVTRYVANASAILAVNERAKTGQKASFGRVLGMGFSRVAWRFFLIDLVIRLPLLLLFLALALLSLSPLALWPAGDPKAGPFGLTAAGFLITGVILLAVAVNAVVGVLMAIFRRACAVEKLGALAAIGRGFSVARHNLRDVTLMAIFAFAAIIAWVILFIPVVLLLTPVFLACLFLGGLVALAILLPLAGAASLVLGDVLAIVLAGTIALAVFVPIIAAPILFLSGLLHLYISNLWTLSYRELRAIEDAAPIPAPKPALAGV
jgi:hypothetical protein